MREVLPHNVELSESDIRNARNGALRSYLSGELEVDITQLGRATKESGLDGNAEITLGSDEAAKRAQDYKYILRSVSPNEICLAN